MKYKRITIIIIIVLILISGVYIYQEEQKQQNAYKTIEETSIEELIENSVDSERIQLTKTESFTPEKDLSKFDKTASEKTKIYYYNSESNTHIELIYTSIRLDYKEQSNTTYTVETQEFLNTTGEVSSYRSTTTLPEDSQQIQSKNAITQELNTQLNENINSIRSVSLIDETTTYSLESDVSVTVNNRSGKILSIQGDSARTTLSYNSEKPSVPQLESEILEENITEEEPSR